MPKLKSKFRIKRGLLAMSINLEPLKNQNNIILRFFDKPGNLKPHLHKGRCLKVYQRNIFNHKYYGYAV